MDRKRRFESTLRHCMRAKRLWLRTRWARTVEQKAENRLYPVGHFRKSSGAGCRGSKKGSRHSPKFGSCCKSGFNYRMTTQIRIDGRRLSKGWLDWVRCYEADDFDDAKHFKWYEY